MHAWQRATYGTLITSVGYAVQGAWFGGLHQLRSLHLHEIGPSVGASHVSLDHQLPQLARITVIGSELTLYGLPRVPHLADTVMVISDFLDVSAPWPEHDKP